MSRGWPRSRRAVSTMVERLRVTLLAPSRITRPEGCSPLETDRSPAPLAICSPENRSLYPCLFHPLAGQSPCQGRVRPRALFADNETPAAWGGCPGGAPGGDLNRGSLYNQTQGVFHGREGQRSMEEFWRGINDSLRDYGGRAGQALLVLVVG